MDGQCNAWPSPGPRQLTDGTNNVDHTGDPRDRRAVLVQEGVHPHPGPRRLRRPFGLTALLCLLFAASPVGTRAMADAMRFDRNETAPCSAALHCGSHGVDETGQNYYANSSGKDDEAYRENDRDHVCRPPAAPPNLASMTSGTMGVGTLSWPDPTRGDVPIADAQGASRCTCKDIPHEDHLGYKGGDSKYAQIYWCCEPYTKTGLHYSDSACNGSQLLDGMYDCREADDKTHENGETNSETAWNLGACQPRKCTCQRTHGNDGNGACSPPTLSSSTTPSTDGKCEAIDVFPLTTRWTTRRLAFATLDPGFAEPSYVHVWSSQCLVSFASNIAGPWMATKTANRA